MGLVQGVRAAALLVLIAPLSQALAQQPGSIEGTVIVTTTGDALPDARITVAGTGQTVFTDAEGGFALRGLAAGEHLLRIRRLGYEQTTTAVTIRSAGVTRVTIRLEPVPIRLAGVDVTVRRPDLQPQAELEQQEVREANPRDAGELLRRLDGVDAVRRGPLGLDPVIRGLRETEVGVYLDGTRMFPAGPARMDSPMSHFDPTAVRELDVVKGPYALTWGAGNLSAIRVETQGVFGAQPGPLHGTLMAGYDQNLDAQEVAASLYGNATDAVSYWVHGAWRQGDDYADGAGGAVPADFVSGEGRGKLGLRLAPGSRLTLAGGYQDQGEIDYPGRLLDAELFHTVNLSARYQLLGGGGALRGLDVLAYVNNVDHAMDNDEKPTADASNIPLPFGLDVGVQSEIDVAGGRIAAELAPHPAWRIEAGADVYRTWRNTVRTIRRRDTGMELPVSGTLMWPRASVWDQGVFVRASTGIGQVSFSATARIDFVQARADTISDFFRTNVGTELDRAETHASGALSLSTALSPNWSVSAGVGSAVRTADATERYSDRSPASKAQTSAEFIGNPALAPERSTQADLWLEASYPRVSLRANAFVRHIDNYITIAPTALPKLLPLSPDVVFQYVNGEADFWGVEGSGAVALLDPLTLQLSGAYLWGEDRTLDEPALGIAPLTLNGGLRYEHGEGRVYAEGLARYTGEQTRVASSRGELSSAATETTVQTGGFTTLDFRGGWRPAAGVELRFGVLNVTDVLYANHLNAKNPFAGTPVPEPGRVWFADMAYSF